MLWQAEEMILVWLSQALRLGGPHLKGDLDSFICYIHLVSNTWCTSAVPKTMSSHPAFLSKQNSIMKKCCSTWHHWAPSSVSAPLIHTFLEYKAMICLQTQLNTPWFAKLNDLIQLDQPELRTGDTNISGHPTHLANSTSLSVCTVFPSQKCFSSFLGLTWHMDKSAAILGQE